MEETLAQFRAVSLAKARATRTAEKLVSEGVQMDGRVGVTSTQALSFSMRRARVAAECLGGYVCHAETVARLRSF